MNKSRKMFGRWGEDEARKFLENCGIKIIAQNIHTQYGEIDILGQGEGQLIFIEVKTSRTRKFGHPEISVNSIKREHMVNSAMQYLQENDFLARDWRIDVISIEIDQSGQKEIHWFKNAINE